MPFAGGSGAPDAASAIELARPSLQTGAFDRGDGKPGTKRTGARHVPAPARQQLPKMVKYRHCRTPVLVPDDFEGALVTRSGVRPSAALRRKLVLGYNGLGKHNRSPNLFTLPDGRLLYCTASLAILADLASGAQSYYEGHGDDICCVALHPNGELVATGQGASAGGADASIHVWSIASRQRLASVGQVLDERKNDGVSTKPFYPGSLCALAFGPDGRLLM